MVIAGASSEIYFFETNSYSLIIGKVLSSSIYNYYDILIFDGVFLAAASDNGEMALITEENGKLVVLKSLIDPSGLTINCLEQKGLIYCLN